MVYVLSRKFRIHAIPKYMCEKNGMKKKIFVRLIVLNQQESIIYNLQVQKEWRRSHTTIKHRVMDIGIGKI